VSTVNKTANRDRDLLEAMDTHQVKLRSAIGRRIRDQVEAEDVFQEVVAEFVEAYDLGQVIDSLGAWLVQVAQNKIFDRFRRKKTQNEYRERVLEGADPSGEVSASQPDEEWTRTLLRLEIADAVELLPEDQRLVFVRHELEGKSFEQIAQETGVSVNTLLSRKRYAVLFLRNYLKEIYDELE
jgi:RNA polymerase sigma factor (sigma-70 family)